MKKVKSILFGLAAVSAVVGLAACGGNTTPTTTPATTTTQAEKVYESDNTKHRVVINATAGEYGDWEAHTWGNWTVTKEATLKEKGSRNHTCTVCGKNVVEEIAKLVPTAGHATEAKAVYAVVPAEWTNANIYYWSKGDADHADEEEIVAASKTSWPGEAMTLVSEADHLYGFIVPVNTYHVIINNGSTQTIDLDFTPDYNKLTLSEKNSEGKYIVDYDNYTPKATDPELATKEFKEYDLYFKLEKELADGEAFHIYYFGGMEAGDWPGKELTAEEITEVSAEQKVYKIHVTADTTFIVNLGNGKLQTENIKPVTSADENLIIVKNATKTVPDGKDAQGNPKTKDMLVAAVGKYDNGTVTEFEPLHLYAKLEGEVPAGKKVYMHTWGSKYEHASWPGLEMTKVEGAEGNVYEVTVPYGSTGFIVSVEDGAQTKNLELQTGKNQNAFVVKSETEQKVEDGKTKTYFKETDDASYANGEFTVIEKVIVTAEGFFVKGTMNEWSDNNDYALTPAADKQSATITLNLAADAEFKVADHGWSSAKNLGYVDSLPAAFANNGGNIKVVEAGRYTITVTIVNNQAQLSITAVPANQA